MFENKGISELQKHDAQIVKFDPDSSPEAWEHFKKVYSNNKFLNNNYDFSNLCFYNRFEYFGLKKGQYWWLSRYKYLNKPLCSKYNRLFIFKKSADKRCFNNVEYIAASYRLSGDCDFNFNNDKLALFHKLVYCDKTASDKEKQSAKLQLDRCHNMHHRLLNFSLMQSIGGLQIFKGKNLDRLDSFVLALDNYYRGVSNDILEEARGNIQALEIFLDGIKDVYNYCKIFYFIEDKNFVDELISQGGKPISNVKELIRYMNLSESYWTKKEFYFLKKEFLTVGSYFQDGGESYSRSELSSKIENDLGFCKEDCNKLIRKCEERGFLTPIGDDVFTR